MKIAKVQPDNSYKIVGNIKKAKDAVAFLKIYETQFEKKNVILLVTDLEAKILDSLLIPKTFYKIFYVD